MIYPVLLCGGSGTRLWPLSRQCLPKQFVKLVGEESLFQASVRRFSGAGFQQPVVVTSDSFRFVVTEQLHATGTTAAATLIEPDPRNTAPAVLCAALWVRSQDPDAVILVVPSDHVIPDPANFRRTVEAALPVARNGEIVTFGIAPARPDTGYGYLELAAPTGQPTAMPQALVRFIEKPDHATAEAMVKAGHYLWNAGIFLFTVETIITAFERHAPDLIAPALEAVQQARPDLQFTRLAEEPWARLQNISIDYAIMEKAQNLSVMSYDGGWSDLGSWEAVWQEGAPDADGNVLSGRALAMDCRQSLLRSESEGLEVVGIGLDDIVAIAMPDAVLVARKNDTQRVRQAVEILKARGVKQATAFRSDHRPWGQYETLATGHRFQVKRIVVKPGAALSLQSHHHRSEHWIVVQGTARVTVGNEVNLLSENESTYIRLGAVHRLENPGKVPMILIEVQTGSYLGEDDIVRYEDIYSRA